jgi:hypothetical protein
MATEADLRLALTMLGTPLHMENNQAMVLSDTSKVGMFDYHACNRNVDAAWVPVIGKEIEQMAVKGAIMHLIAAVDIREINTIIHNSRTQEDAPEAFKAIILDGQHRLAYYREAHKKEPARILRFYVTVYVVSSDLEIRQLIADINKTRPMTTTDNADMNGRLRFVQEWDKYTVGFHTRRCVRRVKNSQLLRQPGISKALASMTDAQIFAKLGEIAGRYKKRFENAPDKFKASVPALVGRSCHLYQLVNDTDGWLDEFIPTTAVPAAIGDLIVIDDEPVQKPPSPKRQREIEEIN